MNNKSKETKSQEFLNHLVNTYGMRITYLSSREIAHEYPTPISRQTVLNYINDLIKDNYLTVEAGTIGMRRVLNVNVDKFKGLEHE